MQTATSERRVDSGKEFDQTREHDHRPGHECWCGFGVGSKEPPGWSPRQRMAVPPKDNPQSEIPNPKSTGGVVFYSDALHRWVSQADVDAEIRSRDKRIDGFERLTRVLSQKVDAIFDDFKRAFGTTPEDFLNDSPTKAA